MINQFIKHRHHTCTLVNMTRTRQCNSIPPLAHQHLPFNMMNEHSIIFLIRASFSHAWIPECHAWKCQLVFFYSWIYIIWGNISLFMVNYWSHLLLKWWTTNRPVLLLLSAKTKSTFLKHFLTLILNMSQRFCLFLIIKFKVSVIINWWWVPLIGNTIRSYF